MKPVLRYQSQLLFRKSYKPNRLIRIRPVPKPSSCFVRLALDQNQKLKLMNAKHIESRFAEISAHLKVRQIPSRWHRGVRQWIDPQDYALDIRRDGHNEFFELRVPTHLSDSLEVNVAQSEPK